MKQKVRYPLAETQLNLKLSHELKERIETYAAKHKMNVSVAIRMILDEKINEEEATERQTA